MCRVLVACGLVVLSAATPVLAQLDPEPLGPPEVTPTAERAMKRALQYLAKNQSTDGSYGMDRYDRNTYPTAISSMVGLAFLSSGSTPTRGPYAIQIRRITEYLLENCVRKSGATAGYLTNDNAWEQRPTYCHAFAMTYLSQVYAMETDPARRKRIRQVLTRAIELTVMSQTEEGGWGYSPSYYEDEGTLCVTKLQALRACRDAGLYVPKTVIDDGVRFIEKSTNSNGSVRYRITSRQVRPGVTCAAVVALWNAGRYEDPLLLRIRSYVDRYIRPRWSSGHHQEYVLYYHAQARFVLGGPMWADFYRQVTSLLVSEQRSDGSFEGSDGGDFFGTAVAALVLYMPYNRLSIYQR